MADKIKKLETKREVCINRINDTLEIAKKAETDSAYHSMLKFRADDMLQIYDEFYTIHNQIISLTEEADAFNAQDAVRKRLDMAYYSVKAINCNIITATAGTSTVNSQKVSNVKLPKISLTTFDGYFKSWPTYFDLFKCLIHENSSLSNIEKFQYLITSLTKEPLALVKSIPMTDANYDTAFDMLVKRYQNKRLLATSYLNEILGAPSVKSNTPRELRHLLDVVSENLAALKVLNFPVDNWDFILFNLLLQKIDSNTRTRFEVEYGASEIPTYQNLYDFLDKHCKALHSFSYLPSNQPNTTPSSRYSHSNPRNTATSSSAQCSKPPHSAFMVSVSSPASGHKSTCSLCKSSHPLNKCYSFIAKPVPERYAFVKQQKLCSNCLRASHTQNSCNSTFSCRICNSRHHTLLHAAPGLVNKTVDPPAENTTASMSTTENISVKSNAPQAFTSLTSTIYSRTTVLLSTAWVEVLDIRGNYQQVRILIDGASEANFISEKCLHRLGLPRNHFSTPICGVNSMSSITSKGVTHCSIKPCGSAEPCFAMDAIVLPEICADMPRISFDAKNWSYLSNLNLADPTFNIPGAVDMLIGAELFPLILRSGRLIGSSGQPSALETCYGWILVGKVQCPSTSNESIVSYCTALDVPLDSTLRKFWEIEQISSVTLPSPDDKKCEELYRKTVSRTPDGRFMVALPVRQSEPDLGDTYSQALRRFLSLEGRFSKNPDLRSLYSDFMQDYCDTGHMSLIKKSESEVDLKCYIPHHAVLKPDRLSTKIRVVFDASCRGSEGISLNQTLLIGPKLQRDIGSILLCFRLHAIAVIADIKQMYRQILVQPGHRDFQRILWRYSPKDPIEEYRLNTVTFGLSSSPYLALRTMKELAQTEETNYPDAARILENYTYVDDLVFSTPSLESALTLQTDLIALLKKGGFELKKWASNHPDILSAVPLSDQQPHSFDLDEPSFIKVLGLQWNPQNDSFTYQCNPSERPCTKRNILSEIARIYDPAGFLSPVSLLAKHIMQTLWASNISWDETPSQDILDIWNQFKSELPELSKISIPRYLMTDNLRLCDLHGFCDASQKGYCAVVYLRVQTNSFYIKTYLLAAKSKVAPLKTLSLPRLELCGAALLADLIHCIQQTFCNILTFDNVFAWCDSMIVLSWLAVSPHHWKTFVANRVSHIQDILPSNTWHYVSSAENAADCASRGLTPASLVKHPTWFTGPHWLSENLETWNFQPHNPLSLNSAEMSSEKRSHVFTTTVENSCFHSLLRDCSSLTKIKRVVALCMRFVHNCHTKPPITGALSFSAIQQALFVLVKEVQSEHFADIFSKIQHNQLLPKPFRRLAVFVDKGGLLRVGGRLRHSELAYDVKHPVLLPHSHRLTQLIIEDVHKTYLHPGYKTLQNLLLQQFWILSPRRAIQRCLSNCVRCFRLKPKSYDPYMGDLPSFRISQIKPFTNTTLDMAGPFLISMSRHRGTRTTKAYVFVFVCAATKAVHLELASDMSSEMFLAAFRRFVARRGVVCNIYTDCGSNFIGANTQLQEYLKSASDCLNINWHFNPPAAPHFNGLSEAGVKSFKTHLYRVVGEQILTYEELYTLLTQIEALLNSRPLCEQSSDPNDLSPLTPGHFLTTEPLNSLPDPDLTHLPLNRLNRWQLIQRMHADFWSRWHREYLHTLQQRYKWAVPTRSLDLNTLVLIKNEQKSPLHWVMVALWSCTLGLMVSQG